MTPCDDVRPLLLDHLFELLDPAEDAAVVAHVNGCAACAAAREETARFQGLVARAAKPVRAIITFAPPAEPVAEPLRAEPPRRSAASVWGKWVLAASLFLAVTALAGPAARDLAGYHFYKPAVDRELVALTDAEARRTEAAARVALKREEAARQVAAARVKHDALVSDWRRVENVAYQEAAGRPFAVDVRGPAAAIPGAPNEYAVRATDRGGKFKPVSVEAAVKDHTGKTRFTQKFDAPAHADGGTLRLPAEMWASVQPSDELFLHVAAVDPTTGERSELTDAIRLREPVFTTFLTTDKPLYRPGEPVYFRSLTLDRTRMLPPDRELTLRFELRNPVDQVVPGGEVVGVARPGLHRNGQVVPVLGPDGKPLKGVGAGAFVLPPDAPGGEYVLHAYDLPHHASRPPAGAKPVASRRLIVHRYTPDRLLKTLEFDARSYGPGDVVQAKFQVKDQAAPVAAALKVAVEADGKPVPLTAAPASTDADGVAAIRFTLPANDLTDARVSITVTSPAAVETLVRRVPLATRRVSVEFFPEGGDLVAGVPNRVYFRATTALGKPADVRGVLLSGDREVARLETLTDADHPGVNQGLGAFTFTPEAGAKYAVRLEKPAGITQPAGGYPLPAVKADGVVLHLPDGVTNPGEPLPVTLHAAGPRRDVIVGVYVRGHSATHRRATVEPGKPTELKLDLSAVTAGGVTRVTVFEDPDGDAADTAALKPIAERLVYRHPAAKLNLGVTAAAHADPKNAGPFAPGHKVRLDIRTRTEADAPTPAVLWAAVVNQSVVTMADDKAERLLPTHFLLAGEVQNPADLEHADFLLTDHPKAEPALDLLLGTQGWRRFAEQAPDQFRKRVPAEQADRLLVAMGAGGPVPRAWRTGVRKVFDDYWPRYEAALAEVEAARAAEANAGTDPDLRAAVEQATGEFDSQHARFGSAAYHLEYFDGRMAERREWLAFAVVVLLGVAALLVALRQANRDPDVRRVLFRGAVGFALLAGFLAASVALTGVGNSGWRLYAVSAPKPEARPNPPWLPAPAQAGPMVAAAGPVGDPGAMDLGGNNPPRNPPRLVNPAPFQAVPIDLPELPPLGDPVAFEQPKRAMKPTLKGLPLGLVEAARDKEFVNRTAEIARETVPLHPPLVAREYAHARKSPPPGEEGTRADFTETLLWHPVLVVPDHGTATLSFDLSDSVAPYRVLVAGHTLDGRIGAVTKLIEVRKLLAVEPKLPAEIGSADVLEVPVQIQHAAPDARNVKLVVAPDGLTVDDGPAERTVPLAPLIGGRATVRLAPFKTDGPVSLKLSASAGPGLTDAVSRTLTVTPDGFPHVGSKSDLLEAAITAPVSVPKALIPGTLRVTVSVYPNTLSELQAGLDGLLHEPHGCFEQSSTANYPNVLITEYLRESGQANPDLSRRARELMDRGYARLTGFECPDSRENCRKGYEWFGAPDAPHQALTAYGLLQFTDMARVFPVDEPMLRRTKEYLVSARDGSGGFKRDAKALDTFGRAPAHVTDAYIVWAITESEARGGAKTDLRPELDALLKQAKSGPAAKDPYFLALVGTALLNSGRTADGVELLAAVAGMQAKDGSVPGATTSITQSGGRDLLIETTALAALGWLKANRPDKFAAPVAAAVGWVGKQRAGGGAFGSTQSTILALKALVEHARLNKKPAEAGELRILVGGNEVGRKPFSTATPGPVVFEVPNAEDVFPAGVTELRVETTAKQAYPATVAWEARTRTPASAANCQVKLATGLDKREFAEGDAARLSVRVENLADRGQGMVVAVVGVPAGLKLPEDMKQLRDLTARPVGGEPTLSFWETRGRELVLYWRGMAPRQTTSFALDLIADVPGRYRGPASRAYLYYDADPKHWVEPLDVRVTAAK